MALTQAKSSNIQDDAVTIAKLAVTDGTAGQVLVTDGNGNLSFSTVSGGGGGSSDWASITNKPTTIAGFGITDAFDGAYGSLTGTPTLFSGSFNDLTQTPTTVAGYGITDALSSTSTTTDIPEGTNLYYTDQRADIRATLRINAADIGNLNNVDETGVSHGKILKYNNANSAWEVADDNTAELVDDTSPQLGGDLDLFAKNIVGNGNIDINGHFHGTNIELETIEPSITLKRLNNANVPSIKWLGQAGAEGANIKFDGTSGNANQLIFETYDNTSLAERFRVTYDGVNVTGALDVSGQSDLDLIRISRGVSNQMIIENVYSSGIQIRGNWLRFQNSAGSDDMIIAKPGNEVELYYNGAKKFETTADGVDVIGNIDINVGTDQNLKVDSNNSQVILSADNDAGNANVNLNYWASSHKFYGDQGATQQLATFNDQIIIPTSATDPTTNLASGGIYFNSTGNALRFYNGTSWGDVSVDLSPFGSLLTSSMPHSGINVSEAGIRTETASFTGATDNGPNNLGAGFGWHDGHEGAPNDWPAYIAVYIGNQYPGGKAVNKLRFCIHGNSFGNYELQGSNDANTSGTFYNTGNWTSIPFQPTGSYYSNQNGGGGGSGISESSVITFLYNNNTPYTHYRIWFKDNSTNGGSGSLGGWACYGWEMSRI